MAAAIPEPRRAAGLRRLYAFAATAGQRYTKARNFDFGPERRNNVSMLSPFLRHRLIVEPEVLDTVLRTHGLKSANKFVQEVFWRGYFKGWLEQHPSVWANYRKDVARCIQSLDSDASLLDRYDTAVAGNTGIGCFDAWMDELRETGYLHNHARMWFASIWIYTLQLPWELGADLFYRFLLDGDAASNTLSWRWVCGLHTRGKTYLARASNIANYTDNRFRPDGRLAISAPPLTETQTHPLEALPSVGTLPAVEPFGLLVTEEDCDPASLLGDAAPSAILGAIATRLRSPLPVGEQARNFAAGAVSDAVQRTAQALGVDGEVQETAEWGELLADWATQHHINVIVTPYTPVGPVAERLAAAQGTLDRNEIRIVKLRRAYDSTVWPHARRGYFKLKEQIPGILDELSLPGAAAPPQSKAG